jgi:DNA-binding LacI/PurR family transcriptional regulator
VTLQTIADRVGVSRMTVSNAFSRPDQLSADLRARILSVADTLGYTGPDPAARALAKGRAGSVGLLLSDSVSDTLTDRVAIEFLAAVAEELNPTGIALTLFSAAEQDGVLPARDVAIDGAFVYSCNPKSSAVSWLLRRNLPLVFVDQAPAPGIPSVNVADRDGAAAAARHLVELGHRRVAIVTTGFAGEFGVVSDPLDMLLANTERQRLVGWLEPLRAKRIRPTIVRIRHAEPYAVGRDAARTLLAQQRMPTGVLCFSDAIARGLIDELDRAGLRVPADVSVVGFDDSPLAETTRPPLTTVHQDVKAKGRAAASALVAAIERGKDAPPARARHVLLPTELVVRESTAPPSG